MKWFRKKKKEDTSPFTIEYYPLTKMYIPKYYHYYLDVFCKTGIVSTTTNLIIAESFKTEEEAIELINKFKEQRFKKGVRIIQIKG